MQPPQDNHGVGSPKPRKHSISLGRSNGSRSKESASESIVEQRLRKLREFYERGCHLFDQPHIRWSELKHMGTTSGQAELLRKARAFANPKTGYSPKQLEALCSMCRKHQFALGVGAVIRLLSVPDRHERDLLQKQAICGHWSNERLVAEIRSRFSRSKPYAGKRVRTPQGPGEALYRIGWLCHRWKGLHDALGRSTNGSGKPLRGTLPKDVRRKLEQVDAAIESLHKAVQNHLPLKKT